MSNVFFIPSSLRTHTFVLRVCSVQKAALSDLQGTKHCGYAGVKSLKKLSVTVVSCTSL